VFAIVAGRSRFRARAADRLAGGDGVDPLFYDSDKAIVGAVQHIADARGVPMAQVALAWVLNNPVVSAPIVGATKPPHLTDTVAALDIRLTDKEVTALEEHYTPRLPTYF
jgi:aryl-alcohol dehydrogenase-like predicted oxidoreductase